MYERGKEVSLESSVGLMVKNLQVVSFDSEWLEIYLGTVSLYNHNHKQVVKSYRLHTTKYNYLCKFLYE